MKLYEINDLILNSVKISEAEAVNTETGEIIDIDVLEHLEMEKNEKIENLIKWYLNLLSDAESLKAEADKFYTRSKSAKNKAEQLKKYLTFLQQGEKFKSADGLHQITFRSTKSVEVVDISKLDKAYLRFKDPEADKKAITEAFKNGIEVNGAVMIEKLSPTIK